MIFAQVFRFQVTVLTDPGKDPTSYSSDCHRGFNKDLVDIPFSGDLSLNLQMISDASFGLTVNICVDITSFV